MNYTQRKKLRKKERTGKKEREGREEGRKEEGNIQDREWGRELIIYYVIMKVSLRRKHSSKVLKDEGKLIT